MDKPMGERICQLNMADKTSSGMVAVSIRNDGKVVLSVGIHVQELVMDRHEAQMLAKVLCIAANRLPKEDTPDA